MVTTCYTTPSLNPFLVDLLIHSIVLMPPRQYEQCQLHQQSWYATYDIHHTPIGCDEVLQGVWRPKGSVYIHT